MDEYDFIFVVLVYRNLNDINDFNDSLKNVNGTYRVVMVESSYDNITTDKFRKIANKYNYDFLPIENKGYSYGNNYGIKYASKNYNFKYLIVSNADIIIQRLDIDILEKKDFDVLGPKIIRKDGKNQNPMYVRKTFINTHFINYVLKKYTKLKFNIYLALYKIENIIYALLKNNNFVYCIHGSFIVFKRQALSVLKNMPFDDKIFLFCEERILSDKCKQNNLKILYDKNIIVHHKEDGSMKMNKECSMSEEVKKSYKYYYENYVKKI